jgi:hypothetical protein
VVDRVSSLVMHFQILKLKRIAIETEKYKEAVIRPLRLSTSHLLMMPFAEWRPAAVPLINAAVLCVDSLAMCCVRLRFPFSLSEPGL